MSYYHYVLSVPERYFRSLSPMTEELSKYRYYSYRCTALEEDSRAYRRLKLQSQNERSGCRVISFGYEKSWPGKKNPPRCINRFMIRYVVSGTGSFCEKEVTKGQFFFSLPYDEHTISSSKNDPLEMYYIGVSGTEVEKIMKEIGFHRISEKICDCPFIDKIPDLFRKPLFEPHTDCDMNTYLMGFFLQLMSYHKIYNDTQQTLLKNDTLYYYNQAVAFMQEYLLDGISAQDVANYLHISPSYLRAIFQKHSDVSIREFLTKKRIDLAANYIVFNHGSIKEASELVGYENYALFYRLFKKNKGVSPQEYKNQFQNEQNHQTPIDS